MKFAEIIATLPAGTVLGLNCGDEIPLDLALSRMADDDSDKWRVDGRWIKNKSGYGVALIVAPEDAEENI